MSHFKEKLFNDIFRAKKMKAVMRPRRKSLKTNPKKKRRPKTRPKK